MLVRAVTESGQSFDEPALERLHASYRQELARGRRRRARDEGPRDAEGVDDDPPDGDWKEQLLDALLAMSPDGFERLARRLLREAGFVSATVMGRSGDGGIDGLGVYRLSLVSFPVFFQ